MVLSQSASSKIVVGAMAQLSHPAIYDGSYVAIPYPNGDVPSDRGACTDVVIRALRRAGYDLQRLIHEDVVHGTSYPRVGRRPDKNIDHRRVPNQVRFFKRFGLSLSLGADWKPGDVVAWKLPSGLDHIGVLVDRRGASGDWMVVHNLSQTSLEDVLRTFRIVGHYRYPK